MKQLKRLFITAALVFGIGFGALAPTPFASANVIDDACTGSGSDSSLCGTGDTGDVSSIISTIVNILLTVAGILAVIMIIFSGIRYTTSAGDTAKVSSAKNSLLYSVIGLAVVMLAFVIVNFVITAF